MKNELCEAEFLDIDWDTTRAGKGNYPFYMEKEIMEMCIRDRCMDDILEVIGETVCVDQIIRPIYNFKAGRKKKRNTLKAEK